MLYYHTLLILCLSCYMLIVIVIVDRIIILYSFHAFDYDDSFSLVYLLAHRLCRLMNTLAEEDGIDEEANE